MYLALIQNILALSTRSMQLTPLVTRFPRFTFFYIPTNFYHRRFRIPSVTELYDLITGRHNGAFYAPPVLNSFPSMHLKQRAAHNYEKPDAPHGLSAPRNRRVRIKEPCDVGSLFCKLRKSPRRNGPRKWLGCNESALENAGNWRRDNNFQAATTKQEDVEYGNSAFWYWTSALHEFMACLGWVDYRHKWVINSPPQLHRKCSKYLWYINGNKVTIFRREENLSYKVKNVLT